MLGGLSSGESEQQEGEVDAVIVNAAVNKIKKVKMMRSESFVMDIMKRRTSQAMTRKLLQLLIPQD